MAHILNAEAPLWAWPDQRWRCRRLRRHRGQSHLSTCHFSLVKKKSWNCKRMLNWMLLDVHVQIIHGTIGFGAWNLRPSARFPKLPTKLWKSLRQRKTMEQLYVKRHLWGRAHGAGGLLGAVTAPFEKLHGLYGILLWLTWPMKHSKCEETQIQYEPWGTVTATSWI